MPPCPNGCWTRSLPANRDSWRTSWWENTATIFPSTGRNKFTASATGFTCPGKVLTRWVELASEWLRPIYEQIRTGVMGGGYVQVDETPVDYLEPGNGENQTGLSVDVQPSRGRCVLPLGNQPRRRVPGQHHPGGLHRHHSVLDGYSAYRAFANGRNGIELARCWAHARRKFHDALEQSPKTAGWIMRQIQHLYQVEARLRESRHGGAGPKLRAAVQRPRKQAHCGTP